MWTFICIYNSIVGLLWQAGVGCSDSTCMVLFTCFKYDLPDPGLADQSWDLSLLSWIKIKQKIDSYLSTICFLVKW